MMKKPYSHCLPSGISKVLAVVLMCCSMCCMHRVYEEEKLFTKYLSIHFPEIFKYDEFQLLTYRTKGMCCTCRMEPVERVLQHAVADKGCMTLYVLTYNMEDKRYVDSLCANEAHCLCGEACVMDKYAVPKVEPLLFTFRHKRIVQVNHYFSR